VSLTHYEQIGEDFIRKAIDEFYRRAFTDMIIGHFFFGKNHDELAAHQIDFTIAALGGPRRYAGRSISEAHGAHDIRRPHFDRRRMILREVLDELGLKPYLRDAWLAQEEAFRPLIVRV
jgi:hemoglobin